MRALTVKPGQARSAVLEDVDAPVGDGDVLVEGIAVGICGTDFEILAGHYGWTPPGHDRLVLGHESLGRVLEAPPDAGVAPGDLVVGIVRRPDPVPCECCAGGEWDMCRNGRYAERGIKELDGYGAQRWRVEQEFLVPVDSGLGDAAVLVEPASVVAKAWEHIERIARRACTSVHTVLITGAGPIGLLAALLARQRELDVHVLDIVEAGPKPDAIRALGATYHCPSLPDAFTPDIAVECTGAATVVLDVIERSAVGGIVCLTGVSSGARTLQIDAAAINRRLVLENDVVFGTVNANRRHYELAARALAAADPAWLQRLITRRVPLDQWHEALERRPNDIKTVIALGGRASFEAELPGPRKQARRSGPFAESG